MSEGMFYDREQIRRDFPHAERAAQDIARLIGSKLPADYGFALLVFSFGPGGFLTHVSNADRADMVKALRECADVLERHGDSPPGVVGQKE